MESHFYVTLFSTSSQSIYPNNTKTRFICNLPQPLHLSGEWEVGLVDFFHDKIIGAKNNSNENLISFDVDEIEQNNFVDVLKGKVTNPIYYTSEYWGKYKDASYYKIDNHESIWTDFDANNERFRAADETVTKIKDVFMDNKDDKLLFNDIDETNKVVKLNRSLQYKGVVDVLSDYLHGFMNMYFLQKEKLQTPAKIAQLKQNTEKLLHKKALEVIQPLETQAHNANQIGSHFVLIYTDIIKNNIIGNSLSKVLHMSDRGSNIDNPVVVTNIQYFPVEREFISDITILIANDRGEQLIFGESSPSKPTSLVLHFRRVYK